LQRLTDKTNEVVSGLQRVARAQDDLGESFLLLDASIGRRLADFDAKFTQHRESSKHDIDLAVEGSLKATIERAMSKDEVERFRALVEERKREDAERRRDLQNAKWQRDGAIVAGLVVLAVQLLATYLQTFHH
ncbi:MAG TPA: hypothetical protein VF765_18775, partial [Polyangiaceae bacterium]